MKSWTPILAAAAILVVAAPAGNAANSTIPRDPGTSSTRVVLRAVPSDVAIARNVAQIKRLIAKNKALTAKNRALAAEGKALKRTIRALEIRLRPSYTPSPGGGSSGSIPSEPSLQECLDYMTGCTPEQECLHWGSNCHPSDPQAGGSTESEPVATEVPTSDELPGLDSSDLPPEVTGTVGFDYSVYDWEG